MNARGVVNQDIEREALECAGWNFEATDTEVLVCRNNHDKGAACDMRPMHPAEVLKLINRLRARVLELEHRAALASQQAWKGEPYAHIVELPAGEYAGTVKFFTAPSDPRGRPVYLHQPSPPSREPQWQPIETAPKDVPLILYGAKRLEMCVGMFHSRDGWVTDTTSEWASMYPPTHWMPLPPPPGTHSRGEGEKA